MKITKYKLKKLIKEELELMQESALPLPGRAGMPALIAGIQSALGDLTSGDLAGALEGLEEMVEVLRDMVEEGDQGGGLRIPGGGPIKLPWEQGMGGSGSPGIGG
jgi:hypothetical protein